MTEKRPLVWGHRGASGYAPENTLEAFALAAHMGADGVELDVQLTKDGEVVVIHDEFIDRTCDGHGLVKDYTLAELRKFNFNKTHADKYAHADIPTLREVCELLAPTKLTINIELKTGAIRYPGMVDKCLAITKECGMADRILYSSFYHPSLMEVKEKSPETPIAFLLADGLMEPESYCLQYGGVAIHPDMWVLEAPVVADCHRAGVKCNVWTVNDRADMERLTKWGVDALITNFPDIALEVQGARQ